jgi:hypothetical protein
LLASRACIHTEKCTAIQTSYVFDNLRLGASFELEENNMSNRHDFVGPDRSRSMGLNGEIGEVKFEAIVNNKIFQRLEGAGSRSSAMVPNPT